VGAIERIQSLVLASNRTQDKSRIPSWWISTQRVRLFMMKQALQWKELQPIALHSSSSKTEGQERDNLMSTKKAIENASPNKMIENHQLRIIIDKSLSQPIDLKASIRLLESQNMYQPKNINEYNRALQIDRFPLWTKQLLQSYLRPGDLAYIIEAEVEDDSSVDEQTEEQSADSLTEVEEYIKLDPHGAVNTLVRLRPELTFLDLFSTVVTISSTRQLLELYGFQIWDVVRQHLQHSLRYLENEVADDGTAIDVERSATLLTVYLRNILSRGVVDPNVVYMDIQELCTRFIWVPAVLEFRKWFYAAIEAPEVNETSSSSEGWAQMGG
jgi:hypothetical protein